MCGCDKELMMKKTIFVSVSLSLLSVFSLSSAYAVSGGITLPENDKLRAEYPAVSGKMLADNCSACHGTLGAEFNEGMPPLAGMSKDSFIKLMKNYRADVHPSIVMHDVAYVFSDAEIEAMADYFASQKAEEWTQENWNHSVVGGAR
jgi:cytochrome c553